MKPNSAKYIAGLYLRLSKDDDKETESSSISTQRKMLRTFAKKNNFTVYKEYIDDGYSGTNFERPSFKKMIEDIENKKINLVITKDLSRLGRDYIISGKYTEIYFPSKSVRYIAINDGYDSENQHTDIAPFKNLINEMYARDTSKKIRSALYAKMSDGHFIGNFAPYGYKKDPKNKNHLIPDEESAIIVRKIFNMAAYGNPPIKIARNLNYNKILTPAEYRCKNHLHLDIDNYSKRKEWTSSTISKMLKNQVYIGNTIQGKTSKISFKSKIKVNRPKEEWVIVKNTHKPIVDKETFDIVKSHSLRRTCEKKGKFTNIFSGIAKCMDCKKNMSAVSSRKKGSQANLVCSKYKLYGKNECTNHFIDYDELYNIVLESIRKNTIINENDKNELYLKFKNSKKESQTDLYKLQLNNLKKELLRIDKIIQNLYEDKINLIISNERFEKLLHKYESDNENVSYKIKNISNLLKNISKDSAKFSKSYEKFLNQIDKLNNIKKLTPNIILKLIDHIEVGQGSYIKIKNKKIKKQKIKIYFRLLGNDNTNIYYV